MWKWAVLEFEPMTYGSESECATHYTTAPHLVHVYRLHILRCKKSSICVLYNVYKLHSCRAATTGRHCRSLCARLEVGRWWESRCILCVHVMYWVIWSLCLSKLVADNEYRHLLHYVTSHAATTITTLLYQSPCWNVRLMIRTLKYVVFHRGNQPCSASSRRLDHRGLVTLTRVWHHSHLRFPGVDPGLEPTTDESDAARSLVSIHCALDPFYEMSGAVKRSKKTTSIRSAEARRERCRQ